MKSGSFQDSSISALLSEAYFSLSHNGSSLLLSETKLFLGLAAILVYIFPWQISHCPVTSNILGLQENPSFTFTASQQLPLRVSLQEFFCIKPGLGVSPQPWRMILQSYYTCIIYEYKARIICITLACLTTNLV